MLRTAASAITSSLLDLLVWPASQDARRGNEEFARAKSLTEAEVLRLKNSAGTSSTGAKRRHKSASTVPPKAGLLFHVAHYRDVSLWLPAERLRIEKRTVFSPDERHQNRPARKK